MLAKQRYAKLRENKMRIDQQICCFISIIETSLLIVPNQSNIYYVHF